MRKKEVYVTTKNGQIKASPIESEIHPSHKTPFYALCISRLHRAVTFENPHQKDAPVLRCRWLFCIRFAFRTLSLPGSCQQGKDVPDALLFPLTSGLPCGLISYSPARFPRKRIRKTHTRPAMFCRNHLAIRFDDPAELPAAFIARKRAYARNRSPKVALAEKTLLQPTIAARKIAQKWTF